MKPGVVPTPRGDAHVYTRRSPRAVATLVLTHGAGGGVDARDLQHLGAILPRMGVTTRLVQMPWRVAGNRLAPPPPVIDECYRAVLERLRPRTPLVLGGRSAGARSACRLGGETGARGVLALSFPLHPPGRPESSRRPELAGCPVPTLVVQGDRDAFGGPEEFPPEIEVVAVPGADHGMSVLKRGPLAQVDALDLVVQSTRRWIGRVVAG